jgi:hypothetical protein
MVDEVHPEVVLFNKFWQIVSFIATLLYSETYRLSTNSEGKTMSALTVK